MCRLHVSPCHCQANQPGTDQHAGTELNSAAQSSAIACCGIFVVVSLFHVQLWVNNKLSLKNLFQLQCGRTYRVAVAVVNEDFSCSFYIVRPVNNSAPGPGYARASSENKIAPFIGLLRSTIPVAQYRETTTVADVWSARWSVSAVTGTLHSIRPSSCAVRRRRPVVIDFSRRMLRYSLYTGALSRCGVAITVRLQTATCWCVLLQQPRGVVEGRPRH